MHAYVHMHVFIVSRNMNRFSLDAAYTMDLKYTKPQREWTAQYKIDVNVH